MIRSTVVLVLFAVALASCTGAEQTDSPTSSSFSATDSAGVELAITTYTGPLEVGWKIADEPSVVFGESVGELVEFSWIRGATRLPDGSVIAADGRAAEIFFFNSDGSLMARAGGDGDGPGEFRRPTGPAVLADTVFVYDPRHMRFSLFTTQGEFIEDRRLEAPDGEDGPRLTLYQLVDASPEGLVLTGSGFFVSSTSPGDHISSNPTLLIGPGGTYLGTTAEPARMWIARAGDSFRMRLLGGSQLVAARNGLMYANDRDRYEIRVHQHGAGLLRVHRLSRTQRRSNDDITRDYIAWQASRIDDAEQRKAIVESMEESPVADSIPWINGMTIDALGNIWVVEYAISEDESGSRGVFSPEGPWLGTIQLPDRMIPLEIGDDYVLAMVRDELDVQHLALFELTR